MRPLDAKTIKSIQEAIEDADGAVGLYALEVESGVLLTNQQWLIEWPHDQVKPCKTLDNLYDAPESAWPEKMREMDWRERFVAHSNFLPWDEIEPDDIDPKARAYFTDFSWDPDGEYHEEFLTVHAVHAGHRQVYYKHNLVAAIEAAFHPEDQPEFVLYEEDREGLAELVLLCVFYCQELVGVLCNCVVREDVVVEDKETGKAAVVVRRPR